MVVSPGQQPPARTKEWVRAAIWWQLALLHGTVLCTQLGVNFVLTFLL